MKQVLLFIVMLGITGLSIAQQTQTKLKLKKIQEAHGQKCDIIVTGEVTNVPCYGDNSGGIDLAVSHTKGQVSYLWNDGSTDKDREAVPAGNYSVKVTDETKRSTTASFTVVQPATPLVVTAKVKPPSAPDECDGGAILNITGGNPLYSITWNDGGTTSCRNDLCPGTQRVCVTDSNGCRVPIKVVIPDAKSFSVSASGNASSIMTKEKLSAVASPNPTKGIVQLAIQSKTNGAAVVSVYDANGKKLSIEKFGVVQGSNNKQIDLSKYSKGIYHIELLVNGEKKMIQILVQ